MERVRSLKNRKSEKKQPCSLQLLPHARKYGRRATASRIMKEMIPGGLNSWSKYKVSVRSDNALTIERPAQADVLIIFFFVTWDLGPSMAIHADTDRKSTRLNSSH